jgi:hypothetical protein
MARVEIGDTEGPAPYSVVRRIIEWETGASGHSVSKSHSQGRPLISAVESEAFECCLSDLRLEEKRDGVWGNQSGFPNRTPSEEFALGDYGKNEKAECGHNPPTMLFVASALAGVEGEHTPANTQGAGASEAANPPKAP